MKIYPIEYKDLVQKYSEEYDVDKYLVLAIIKAESNFKDDAVSGKGAKGLMQLMDSTAEDIASSLNMNLNVDDDILNPEININLGTKYVSMMMKKYNCIELALAAYNAGSGNVDSWIKDGTLKDDGSDIENIPYKETNNYVRKILRDYEIYKKLYE
jgi:soluble lytic murein transglycosylase